jgi:hypothetical protein
LIGGFMLPAAWTIRGMLLPANPEGGAASKLIMNLIEGSHPEFLSTYHAARVEQDPRAIQILDAVTQEQSAAIQSPLVGINTLLTRFAASPLRYLR